MLLFIWLVIQCSSKCCIHIPSNYIGMSIENIPLDINLPESELVKMEEAFRERGQNRIERKKSIEKRSSARFKNIGR